ncbi:MAG TPA: M20/M25/M40 family metallo-hydrolase [Methylomirabilota bacterium]|nr:M20/M25/M40 family metallo-hydrolase [Methylomirabilota bacterium]
MIRRFVTFSAVLLIVTVAGAAARSAVVPPQAASLAESVNALTTPEMEGRRSGTPGGEHAARRLAEWLAAAGLRPGGDAGSFLQTFVLETSSRPDPASSLELLGPTGRKLDFGREWIAHGGSRAGEVSGDVVFAGYGADIPEAKYDDYAGVDVRGKIALVLDGAPAHLADARVTRLDKLIAAKRRGAAAVLIAGAELPTPDKTAVEVALPSAALTREAADAILAPAGRTTADAASAMSKARGSAPFPTGTRVHLRVEKVVDEVRAANVIGILPGTDPALAPEAVVIGAHYDHLGLADGVVYPGADDNASGTAVVVGLARAFAAAGGNARTLVFALFGAEELGLIGSRHYVDRPAVPLDRTVAMVNFDMVGRLQGRTLSIGGGDSGNRLRALVSQAAQLEGMTLDLHGSPYGPSDHARFYAAGVPVLFFYTGGHSDYHKPSDTADKIDAAGMARIAALGARVVDGLASEARPVYAQVTRPARHQNQGSGASGGALLGVVAVPRPGGDGLRLSSVMSGTGAERAGLREGDVIVRFAGTAVDGLEELRTLIRERKPGDTIPVLYLRNGEAHSTSATLGPRID